MGNEWLKIADGFSLVADGLRGLASAEGNAVIDTAEKDAVSQQIKFIYYRRFAAN